MNLFTNIGFLAEPTSGAHEAPRLKADGTGGANPPRPEVHTLLTMTRTTRTNWREKSACRDSEPTLFFPIGTTGLAVEQIEEAKGICADCPVTEDCLQYALQTNQEAGVWGGYAEDERRRLRKRWLAERRRAAS